MEMMRSQSTGKKPPHGMKSRKMERRVRTSPFKREPQTSQVAHEVILYVHTVVTHTHPGVRSVWKAQKRAGSDSSCAVPSLSREVPIPLTAGASAWLSWLMVSSETLNLALLFFSVNITPVPNYCYIIFLPPADSTPQPLLPSASRTTMLARI